MATKHEHDNPILVTGAAGAVGGIGRNLTEFLIARAVQFDSSVVFLTVLREITHLDSG